MLMAPPSRPPVGSDEVYGPEVTLILQVVALDAPIEIRQAAAVNFKNYVKFNWVSKGPHCKPQTNSHCAPVVSLWGRLELRMSTAQVPSNADKQPIPDAEKVWQCQTSHLMYGVHPPDQSVRHQPICAVSEFIVIAVL